MLTSSTLAPSGPRAPSTAILAPRGQLMLSPLALAFAVVVMPARGARASTAAETPEGLHVDCPRGSKMAVLGALAPLGTALQDLQIQEPSLEDVYFDLRKG